MLKKERVRQTGSVFLGRDYGEAGATLRRYGQPGAGGGLRRSVRAEAAEALAAGKVVGWFQGGAECGPRALGNRSILADPRLPHIRDHINARVKFREDFRPFAPSVLAEEAHIYFDCDHASPHMLLTAPVRPEWREKIPAVVHQDGSARLQTVTEADNPLYCRLLRLFKEKTSIGMLLNTSLNRRGIPIVETPEDAMLLFLYSGLDLLFIDNTVVKKPADFAARLANFDRQMAQSAARKTFQQALSV